MRIRIGPSLVLAGAVATALYTFVSIQRSGAAALFLESRRCCQLRAAAKYLRGGQRRMEVPRARR